ncbi:MAG: hypothetical protein AAF468_08000 [Pseudomonadota bacterium]
MLTSAAAHSALIAFGAFTITAPSALEVADVEALPIEIVTQADVTRIIKGEKDASIADRPAPKPTLRPQIEEPAQFIGEADKDISDEPVKETAPAPVKSAEESAPQPAKEAAPVSTPKLAAEPEAPVQVATLPAEDEQPASEAEPAEEAFKLPERVPVPKSKPTPPKPQIARTNERKISEKPPAKQVVESKKEQKNTKDQIEALLNKQKPKGGGAKQQKRVAALGGTKTNTNAKLSQSELDALRGQIQKCFSVSGGMADAEDLRVKVEFRLDESGALEGRPTVSAQGGNKVARRALAGSAKRAVLRCAPYKLPIEKYADWAEVEVNFSLQDML